MIAPPIRKKQSRKTIDAKLAENGVIAFWPFTLEDLREWYATDKISMQQLEEGVWEVLCYDAGLKTPPFSMPKMERILT
jgi:hypothetical protein